MGEGKRWDEDGVPGHPVDHRRVADEVAGSRHLLEVDAGVVSGRCAGRCEDVVDLDELDLTPWLEYFVGGLDTQLAEVRERGRQAILVDVAWPMDSESPLTL